MSIADAHRTPPPIAPASASREPVGRQIYRQLRRLIRHGRLRAGARQLSTRQLASDFGVSRNTVVFAHEELKAEGYILSEVGAGSPVAPPSRAVLSFGYRFAKGLRPYGLAVCPRTSTSRAIASAGPSMSTSRRSMSFRKSFGQSSPPIAVREACASFCAASGTDQATCAKTGRARSIISSDAVRLIRK